MKAKMPSAWPRGPHRRAYTPSADHGEEGQVARERPVVEQDRQREDGQPAAGSSAVVTAWPRTVGVGDGEQGEQRGEPAGDGHGQRLPGRPGDGRRQPDAEHGPGRAAQPQPAPGPGRRTSWSVRRAERTRPRRLPCSSPGPHRSSSAPPCASTPAPRPAPGHRSASRHRKGAAGPDGFLAARHAAAPVGQPEKHPAGQWLNRSPEQWAIGTVGREILYHEEANGPWRSTSWTPAS